MLRDSGPNNSVVFGIRSDDLGIGEIEGGDPEGGAVANYLQNRPVQRFFAAGGLAIAGAVASGSLLRRGGTKLIGQAVQRAAHGGDQSSQYRDGIRVFREFQESLDNLEGVTRTRGRSRFVDSSGDVRYQDDPTRDGSEIINHSFFYRKSEKDAGKSTSAEWLLRDEIQQKLVRSARRLPYELPAAYATQRLFTDRLLGIQDDEGPVVQSWYTAPVDILGDFAEQSVKNLAFAFLPFDVGRAGASHGYRKLMEASTGPTSGVPSVVQESMVSARQVLSLVGHSSSDLIADTVRRSRLTTGAASRAVHEATIDKQSLVDQMHSIRQSGVFEYFKRVSEGKETFNMHHQAAKAFKRYKDLKKSDTFARELFEGAQGNTALERMAASTARHRYVSAENAIDGIETIGMARAQAQGDAYRTILTQQLRGLGGGKISEADAARFADMFRITLPGRGSSQADISRRIVTQRGQILADEDNWETTLAKMIEPVFSDRGTASAISQSLSRAIDTTDAVFRARIDVINESADNAFNHLFRNVIPQEAKRSLGRVKGAYADFGPGASKESREYLVRRTAERLGVSSGPHETARVSTSELRKRIRQRGFDPSNDAQLRGYLVTKGDISKPWTANAYNIFGIRPLSIAEAQESGFFAGSRHSGEIDRIADAIKGSDWDSEALSRISVGGVYRTATGRIIDTTPIRQSGRNLLDSLASQIKVPLIQLKPLEMLGYGIKREVDQKGFFQFSIGGRHPFLPPGAQDDAYGHLWARSGRGKGRVHTLRRDSASGDFYSELQPGTYRPLPTDPLTLAGRTNRLALGESGRVVPHPDDPSSAMERFKQAFNVDPNKNVSLFAALRRVFTSAEKSASRPDIASDPGFFANVLHEELAKISGGLSSNTAIRSSIEEAIGRASSRIGPETFADHARRFMNQMSRFTFGGRLQRQAVATDANTPLLKRLFSADIKGDKGPVPLQDMSASQTLRYVDQLLEEPVPLSSGVGARLIERSKQELKRSIEDVGSPSDLDRTVTGSQASMGINRRIDLIRRQIMRHHAVKESLSEGQDALSLVSDMIGEIDSLYGRGLVGTREAAQARAAVGSIYVDHVRVSSSSGGLTARQNIEQSMLVNFLAGRPGIPVNQVALGTLEDAANYHTSGPVGALAQRVFGQSKYQFPGLEYDPFGVASDFTLVPTFGTAFQQDPKGALNSALGLTTWSDPSSFSGAGIAVSHIFERMNKAVSIFGLGVDSSQFKGPLDMFYRGNIGQRMLPAYAGAVTFAAVDRTAGGYIYGDVDEQGERVYKPFMGTALAEVGAAAQVTMADLTPWGLSGDEMAHQLYEGEVPVRKGRFWPLGNTSFWGGSPEYYRPSWYRRMHGAYQYTSDHYGSPMERLAFGYDFSPGRIIQPYRYEDKHFYERPYPVTGDYFTGPWGPLTPALNATVGRILKPRQTMHDEQMQFNLSRYRPVGDYGMAPPSTYLPTGDEFTVSDALAPSPGTGGFGLPIGASGGQIDTGVAQRYSQAAGAGPAYLSGSPAAAMDLVSNARMYADAAHTPDNRAQASLYPYVDMAAAGQVVPSRPIDVSMAGEPISPGGLSYQGYDLAYRMQEYSGIYGFAFGALREQLGFGEMEYDRPNAILANPSDAYGAGRQFWDLNLGGLGDVPTPFEGQFSNLEISEVVRRFIPKPRNQDYINPIPNLMGVEHPWLPGPEGLTNFQWGDPFTAVPEGEMRLPGVGYERFNRLSPDETGQYGRMDRLRILGDVAPYSQEFRQTLAEIQSSYPDALQQMEVNQILERVENVKRRNEFNEYQYQGSSPSEMGITAPEFAIGSAVERFRHMDSYVHTKLIGQRTALEDWERSNVYGSSFPEWGTPIQSFARPAFQKSADRHPLQAGASMGVLGWMMGATRPAKAVGGMLGFGMGSMAGLYGTGYEFVTGDRYMPRSRRREIAIEEQADVLEYVRARRGYNLAMAENNTMVANYFKRQMKSTMYGADLYESSPEELERAIPKRKREHFREFLYADEGDRERILSTAGRLERRIYQAAWGMRVEARPSLDEVFQDRELPPPDWEGYDPRVNMDHIKIKMLQQEGLKASEMGFFPQQVREANLTNPSYPMFNAPSSTRSTRAELEQVLYDQGMAGSIREVKTPFPGIRLNVNVGV